MKNYTPADKIQLVHSGSDYFDVLERMIEEARESIELQTYIFDYDDTGKRITSCLKIAKARGIRITVLADAFGSNGYPSSVVKELQALGIHFRFFSPLFSNEGVSFGRRLHHKIVVVDRTKALAGGINIADKYKGKGPEQPWLDYAIYIEGKVCGQLTHLCKRIYDKKPEFLSQLKERKRPETQSPGLVRFRRNDWLFGKNEVHRSYLEALISAEKSITLVASYFLPGRVFRKQLRNAAARGVEIKIILAGKSDVPIIYLAENYLYQFYLRNNMQIYQWKNSVMHGKAMTTDGTWATIGSYNLNYLSQYLSIELNTDIKDTDFVSGFDVHLKEIMRDKCVRILNSGNSHRTSLLQRIKMRLGYAIYKMMMNLMLTRRKHNPEKER
jgi:cardiolipin synthase